MPKHITASVRLHPDKKKATVTVTNITYEGHFSAKGMSEASHHSGVYRHENILLILTGYNDYRIAPEVSSINGKHYHYFLLDRRGGDIVIPANMWPQIRAAIESYNKWGETQP